MDSKQYAWKDITLVIGGRVIEGVTNVKWGYKREKEYLYGRGDDAHEIQHGNREFSGELELWHSAVEELMAIAPNGDITLLRMGMTVDLALEMSDKRSTYNIAAMEFEEVNFDYKQGDKFSLVSLPIKFLGLKKVA